MKNFTFENLSFYYGKKIVLNNISFTINSNDVVALVGPNGVGKTTLLNIISHKIDSVSYLKDDPGFYPYLSGEENLKAFDLIIENKFVNTKDALEIVNLQCDKDKKYKKYSLGMKKRLGIAKCLLKKSDIYLFDEPLNGLDAKSIILFRDIIRLLKDNDKTVIISSHILGELNIYCNKILYLNGDGYIFSDLNKEKTIEDIFKGDLYEK